MDLDWHVADGTGADPLSDEEFRHAVGTILSERLDHARPLWRLDLLPMTGDRVGLVGRIHHALADGVTAIRVSAGLLWDVDPRPPVPHAQADTPKPPSQQAEEARILVRLPSALWRELRPGEDSVSTSTSAPDARWPGPPSRWCA